MIIAITQARVSSTRCPGKVLKPILNHPMAWHQLERSKRARLIDQSILATSNDASDDVLADYFNKHHEVVYRGSLNNVLNRYYECAKHYQATHIVRLTADCPLIDPEVIDQTIACHLEQHNDYTSTQQFPIGISVEVFRFEALEIAYYEANLSSQREHVTLFLYQHPERFKIGAFSSKQDLSHLRWTVDYPEDFEFVTQIYQRLYPEKRNFNNADVLALLEQHPELSQLNAHIKPNEGLIKSLAEDKPMSYQDR